MRRGEGAARNGPRVALFESRFLKKDGKRILLSLACPN